MQKFIKLIFMMLTVITLTHTYTLANTPAFQTIYSFGAGGYSAAALVEDTSGTLYGTTIEGVFKLTPPSPGKTSWAETVLHDFSSTAGQDSLQSGLILDESGTLYGTTENGGPSYHGKNGGLVFKLTPPSNGKTAWIATTLHGFTGGTGGGTMQYQGLTLGNKGVLYGTTENGGTEDGGVSFKLVPPAPGKISWTETVLHNFGSGGANPTGTLLEGKAGVLYGMAENGGPNNSLGIVFELVESHSGKTAWIERVLHSFSGGTDGAFPVGGVVMDKSGALYGMTSAGGNSSECELGCGVVFKLAPPLSGKTAWTETILHKFTGGRDGGQPFGDRLLTLDTSGVIYGTTSSGGNVNDCDGFGCGVVFKLTPPRSGKTTWTETVLHQFTGGQDGKSPLSGVIMSKSGVLYGTCYSGGKGGTGVVYMLKP